MCCYFLVKVVIENSTYTFMVGFGIFGYDSGKSSFSVQGIVLYEVCVGPHSEQHEEYLVAMRRLRRSRQEEGVCILPLVLRGINVRSGIDK